MLFTPAQQQSLADYLASLQSNKGLIFVWADIVRVASHYPELVNQCDWATLAIIPPPEARFH